MAIKFNSQEVADTDEEPLVPRAKFDTIPIAHANIAAASPVKALVIGLWLHLGLPFESHTRQINVHCHNGTILPYLRGGLPS